MLKSTFTVAAMLLALTSLALAQPRGGHAQMRGSMAGHGDMMAQLKLTDDQQTQIKKLHYDFQKKAIQDGSKIQLARLDLRQLISADPPDKASIEAKLKEVSDLQYQKKLDLVDHLFAVRAILTPEQRKMWKEHMHNMWEGNHGAGMRSGRSRMGSGRGMGGGMGMGMMMDPEEQDSPQDPAGE